MKAEFIYLLKMSKRQVCFSLPDSGRLPSPLLPEEEEPVIIDSETYKIENFCAANQDLLCPLDRIQPTMPKYSEGKSPSFAFAKAPQFSQSMPLISLQKLNLTKGIIKCTENMIGEIFPKCVYDQSLHFNQIKTIEKIPECPKKETVIISTTRKLIELMPESETELISELEKIVVENDSLKLVPFHQKLTEVYDKYIEEPDQADDEFFILLSKILVFSSRFSVKNFCARDASVIANCAAENVYPQHRKFFSQLSEALNCDFIDKNLRERLIEFLKYFNERIVISLRWVLLNINEHQIVSQEIRNPTMEFSLSRPVEGTELSQEASFNAKKILYRVAECASHAALILRKPEGSEVVNSWRGYFETTETCYKSIAKDCSPQRLIQNGPLYGKSISALTKFGPVSGKINPELPEIVSEIVSNISVLDEMVAHTRSGYILIENVISSFTDATRKLRELAMTVRDPPDANNCGMLYYNLVKICALAHNPSIDQTALNRLAPHVDLIAQCAPKNAYNTMAQVVFQLANVNMRLNPTQMAFIHAELSLNALSHALTRSVKKLRDPQQKQYASQWASYTNSLTGCVHALASDKSPKRQVADIISVLSPIKLRAANMFVIDEAATAINSLITLYESIVDVNYLPEDN